MCIIAFLLLLFNRKEIYKKERNIELIRKIILFELSIISLNIIVQLLIIKIFH